MSSTEPVIVNGVDVKDCCHLGWKIYLQQSIPICKIMQTILGASSSDCENFPKCQYKILLKQLKDKTLECEELKNATGTDRSYDKLLVYLKAVDQILDVLYNVGNKATGEYSERIWNEIVSPIIQILESAQCSYEKTETKS